jgi:peptidoglycan/LPS O-acetylase OafA/YrhL
MTKNQSQGADGVIILPFDQFQMKNQSLEGLRGLASLMVVFSHLTLTFWPHMQVNVIHEPHAAWQDSFFNTPLTFLCNGSFAVCIFFVLSGYVLSARFLRTGDTRAIANLFTRRYARLMPPVLASVMIGYVLLACGAVLVHDPRTPTWLSWTFREPPSLSAALSDGLWKAYLTEGAASYNPPGWTMQYEFLGSLLTFAICLMTAGLTRRWILYMATIIALLATLPMGIYYVLFVCGIWIADSKNLRISTMQSVALIALSCCLGGSTAGSMSHDVFWFLRININGHVTQYPQIAQALASIIVVKTVLSNERIAAFFARFAELGRRSFSLYLIHFLVLSSAGMWTYFKLGGENAPVNGGAAAAASAVVIVLSYVAAGWFAALFDAPAIRYSRAVASFFLPKPAKVEISGDAPQNAG